MSREEIIRGLLIEAFIPGLNLKLGSHVRLPGDR